MEKVGMEENDVARLIRIIAKYMDEKGLTIDLVTSGNTEIFVFQQSVDGVLVEVVRYTYSFEECKFLHTPTPSDKQETRRIHEIIGPIRKDFLRLMTHFKGDIYQAETQPIFDAMERVERRR